MHLFALDFLALCVRRIHAQNRYRSFLNAKEAANRQAYRARTARAMSDANGRSLVDLTLEPDVILDVAVEAGGLVARCDAETRSNATEQIVEVRVGFVDLVHASLGYDSFLPVFDG